MARCFKGCVCCAKTTEGDLSRVLPSFSVTARVVGIRQDQATQAVSELHDELLQLPHYQNTQVSWDNQGNFVVVSVQTEGLDAESTGKGVAEEIHELLPAIFVRVAGMHVEILSVRSMN